METVFRTIMEYPSPHMTETTMQTDGTVVQRSEEHGGIKHVTTPTLMGNIDGKMNPNLGSQGILSIILTSFYFRKYSNQLFSQRNLEFECVSSL